MNARAESGPPGSPQMLLLAEAGLAPLKYSLIQSA